MTDVGTTSGSGSPGSTTAADQASEVGERAKERAADVAATVKEQAGAVAHGVSEQTQNLVQEAKHNLQDQARGRTNELAGLLQRWSDQGRALARTNDPEAGEAGRYIAQASEKLDDLARHVEQRGFDGLVDDVQRFARQRPGVFLLGAGVAGFVIGRVLRGASANANGSPATSNGDTAADVGRAAIAAPGLEPQRDVRSSHTPVGLPGVGGTQPPLGGGW